MSTAGNLYIGTSGWSYPDWEGIVYPRERTARRTPLTYLARFLNAVEINTSFYRPPSPRMAEGWLRQTAEIPDFRFTAKLWQRFTHERATPWTAQEAGWVADGLKPLREAGRLGALLLQFPWSFRATPENGDWLARVGETFAEFPCVVEVRHASWDTPEHVDWLKRHALSFCNVDQPPAKSGIGRTAHRTGPVGYFRFHGRNSAAWFNRDAGPNERYNYLYNEEELAPWAASIADAARAPGEVFVMANNHYKGQAVVNALQIKARLTGRNVAAPAALIEAYPVLRAVAAPAGQTTLPF